MTTKHEVENGYYAIHVMNCTIHGKKHGVWDVWQTLEADVPYTFKDAVEQVIEALDMHEKYRVHYINLATIPLDVANLIQAEIDERAEANRGCNHCGKFSCGCDDAYQTSRELEHA